MPALRGGTIDERPSQTAAPRRRVMRTTNIVLITFAWAVSARHVHADDPVRLREAFAPGYQYHVSSRVELTGKLTLPADKGKPPQTLEIAGKSAVDYDERILAAKDQRVEKTIRYVHKL